MALKILLADDNITAQKMGSKILTDAGYVVVAVSNGAAAMKKIASEKPDLLILDVYMPGYSGLEVCQMTKSNAATAAVPVLLTVTNMEPFNPEDGHRVQADGVMIKPFEASDVVAVVRKFETKLESAPPVQAEPEGSAKAAAAAVQDAGYPEWKVEPAAEEQAPQQVAVPQEMAAAPALGTEDMLVPAAAPQPEPPMATGFELTGFEASAEASAPVTELQPVAPAQEYAAEPVIMPASAVEFTAAPQMVEMEVTPAAVLDLPAADSEAPITQDPALVTDPADMAQFVTKFAETDQSSFTPLQEVAETETLVAIPDMPAPAAEAAVPVPFADVVEEAAPQEPPPSFQSPVEIPVEEGTASEPPVQEQPVEEAAASEPPVQEQPAEEATASEPPVEQRSVEEATASEPPVEEIPVEEAPAAELPVEEAAVEESPVATEAQGEVLWAQEDSPAVESALVEEIVREGKSISASLQEEIRQAFDAGSGVAAAPALAPEPAPADAEPLMEAGPFDDKPAAPAAELPLPPAPPVSDELVEHVAVDWPGVVPTEARAEEVPQPVAEAAPEPAAGVAFDEQRVSEAVQRVLGRYKDELVAAIVRELKS